MNIERGNIYRVNFDPAIDSEQQGNSRPCVVLTLTAYNRQLRTIGVVPLTSSPTGTRSFDCSGTVCWQGKLDGALPSDSLDL